MLLAGLGIPLIYLVRLVAKLVGRIDDTKSLGQSKGLVTVALRILGVGLLFAEGCLVAWPLSILP